VLRIPEYGPETMVITRVGSAIDVLSLAVGASADLRRLSYRTLPRHIDTVTGKQPNFGWESGTYHKFVFACPQGAHKEDCSSEVTSTKEKPNGAWRISSCAHGYQNYIISGLV
jgi:hypothetical protein